MVKAQYPSDDIWQDILRDMLAGRNFDSVTVCGCRQELAVRLGISLRIVESRKTAIRDMMRQIVNELVNQQHVLASATIGDAAENGIDDAGETVQAVTKDLFGEELDDEAKNRVYLITISCVVQLHRRQMGCNLRMNLSLIHI